ncbi:MAG: ACP S-malonyltransferase [Oscillospiraceae bacterium]
MADAVKDRPCGMAAVLNLDRDTLKQICEDAVRRGAWWRCANFNCPGQIVISGDADAVDRAGELAKAAGAKRVLPLEGQRPLPHLSLHGPRRGRSARRSSEACAFREMEIPVLFNCLGGLKGEHDAIPELLVQPGPEPASIWRTPSAAMAELGVDTRGGDRPGQGPSSGFVRKTAKQDSNAYRGGDGGGAGGRHRRPERSVTP